MTNEKALAIFHLTLKKTVEGAMEWRQLNDAPAQDIYSCQTAGGFTLRVYPHTSYDDEEGEGPPSLSLFDSGGQMVFDITVQLDGVSEPELRKLYDEAERIALGTDDKLDMILKDLGEMGPDSQ